MIFFRSQIAAGELIPLQPDEIRHCRALRLTEPFTALVSNRRDQYCEALIQTTNWQMQLSETRPIPRPRQSISLAMALPESKRWDWLIQKATELGVAAIWPVIWQRSDRRDYNRKRSIRIAEQACSQCGRLDVPRLYDPLKPVDFWGPRGFSIEQDPTMPPSEPCKCVWLNPAAKEPLIAQGLSDPGNASSVRNIPVIYFIGPEGGFSPAELEMFQDSAIPDFSLGPYTLRIETAALAVLALHLSAM